MNTWSVDKDHLQIIFRFNAQQCMPGGLRLTGGNTKLLPQNMIEQSRLAYIGAANNSHIAAAG
jgi:hypothetical protein